MGNSNSVSINDFQNQLISTCLWSLRHEEIKTLYYKNRNNKLMLNADYNTINNDSVPHLYQPHLLKKNVQHFYTPIYNLDTDPNKIYTKMINEYLNHILQNKEETDNLMQEIISKLNPINSDIIGESDSISLNLPVNYQNDLQNSINSYNNLMNTSE
jgi:hypothetical protein